MSQMRCKTSDEISDDATADIRREVRQRRR
jgi:hypothetical protein